MWVKHYYFSKHQKMDEREEQEGEPRELAPHWPRSQETRGGGGSHCVTGKQPAGWTSRG